ncbi:MAG: UDP-N-acetylmuramoyl-L-alanine--D-glutamate ligase [Clostridia bacterium]|nr:UDP-N-acetylmuramoyl-L-alanine--D-glutamate ligase [Clostridia bacterium]
MTRASEFFKSIKDKKVAFIGIGVSNTDSILMFLKNGIDVTACDKAPREKLGEVADKLESAGAQLRLGENYLDGLCDFDVVVRTPGMMYHVPELQKARKMGVAVTSEMELFFELCPCKIFAVTGSDGKTTTTTVISKFLEAQGKTVHLGGNIGRALLPIIDTITPDDFAVVELSSFQLMSMRQSPDVAVVTNVTPNHLDKHTDMDDYVDAKKNILLHQNAFSKAVLNLDNETSNSMKSLVRGKAYSFSRREVLENGAYINAEGEIFMAVNSVSVKVMDRADIKLVGDHNVENYLAAITAVWGYVDVENIVSVARTFSGVEHRMELVRERNGVKWYNDSIATSPTRTNAGLKAHTQKVVLIAGGYDKKIPYEPLAPYVIDKVKALILMGATAQKIRKAVEECDGFNPDLLPIYEASDMEHAVKIADEISQKGDIVAFSPASASFDFYKNFEQRGIHFKNIVNSL